MKRVFAIFIIFVISACVTKSYDDTRITTHNEILRLNIAKIKIEGITSLNTYCEADADICPKDALLDWITRNIKIEGDHGSLLIAINEALLTRSETKDKFDNYQGSYDITLKLFENDTLLDNYTELNIVAENYNTLSPNKTLKDKKEILKKQIVELIHLLEDEIINKSHLYFSDHLIK